jgi:hypothetical protein
MIISYFVIYWICCDRINDSCQHEIRGYII